MKAITLSILAIITLTGTASANELSKRCKDKVAAAAKSLHVLNNSKAAKDSAKVYFLSSYNSEEETTKNWSVDFSSRGMLTGSYTVGVQPSTCYISHVTESSVE